MNKKKLCGTHREARLSARSCAARTTCGRVCDGDAAGNSATTTASRLAWCAATNSATSAAGGRYPAAKQEDMRHHKEQEYPTETIWRQRHQ